MLQLKNTKLKLIITSQPNYYLLNSFDSIT